VPPPARRIVVLHRLECEDARRVQEVVTRGTFILLLWAGTLAAQAPAPVMVPAPPDWIRGSTLTASGWNFAMDSPGPSWEWLQTSLPGLPAGSVFICRDSVTDARITLNVMEKETRGGSSEQFGQGFLKGAKEKLQQGGWSMSDEVVGASDVPSATLRYSATARRADGAIFYTRGYVIQADRVYTIQELSPEIAESGALRSMVRSFRFLEKPRAYRRPSLGALYFALLLLPWATSALINRLVGRSLINGALVSATLIVLAAGALVAPMAGTADAETIGYRIGEAAVPLVIAAIFAWRFRRSAGRP
jgi:hypothetical protein